MVICEVVISQMIRFVLLVLVAVLMSGFVFLACSVNEEVPILEQRAQEINQSVMCPVCPGESIDQSQHPLAVQMRDIVSEKVGLGWSDNEVKAYLVEAYGLRVLLDPPYSGASLILWVVPPIGIALAVVVLFVILRMMLRSGSELVDEPMGLGELSRHERDVYIAEIESVLAEEATDIPDKMFDKEKN